MRRRREMMQAATSEIWRPIATTPMQFKTYGTGVSFNSSTGVLSFSKGSTSWGNYCKLINMPYKYSDLENHHIKVEFDYTIAGSVGSGNSGLVFVPNEYSNNTANSTRKAGISQNTTGLKFSDSSGHASWSGILTTDLLTYGPENHSANNYWGAMIAFHAATTASATMYNIVYEFLQ